MARTAARFTQADVERALRAARSVGDDLAVRVLPDGTIEIARKSGGEDDAVAPSTKWVP